MFRILSDLLDDAVDHARLNLILEGNFFMRCLLNDYLVRYSDLLLVLQSAELAGLPREELVGVVLVAAALQRRYSLPKDGELPAGLWDCHCFYDFCVVFLPILKGSSDIGVLRVMLRASAEILVVLKNSFCSFRKDSHDLVEPGLVLPHLLF